jgi:hypothetical protein
MKQYLYRVGISLSVLINVILMGELHQTFSARNHQRKRDKKRNLCVVIDKMLGRSWFDDCVPSNDCVQR